MRSGHSRRLLSISTVLACTMGITAGIAAAQSQRGPSKADEPHGDKRLLDRPYITGTGATVDKPGVPQASGPTKLDRGIMRQDNKIDNSICRGCTK